MRLVLYRGGPAPEEKRLRGREDATEDLILLGMAWEVLWRPSWALACWETLGWRGS